MFPVFCHLGAFTIYWYGVMAAAGFLLGGMLVSRNRKLAGMSADQVSGTMMTAIVAGIVGARLFYVVQFYDHYRDDWWGMLRIDQGGLVFYGGFLLAIAALYGYCRRAKLDFIRVLDVCTPAIALAHACGRIGCFSKGCCFGRPTELWWGVVFPSGSAPALRYGAVPLHPVQLVEAGENLLVCALMLLLLKKTGRGTAMSLYLVIYGVLRFGNELLRGDNPQYGGFTPAQWIGLALIPCGLILWAVFRYHERHHA